MKQTWVPQLREEKKQATGRKEDSILTKHTHQLHPAQSHQTDKEWQKGTHVALIISFKGMEAIS